VLCFSNDIVQYKSHYVLYLIFVDLTLISATKNLYNEEFCDCSSNQILLGW